MASSDSVRHKVLSLAAEFDQFCSKQKKKEQPALEIKWKPPKHDVLKINVDGSIDPTSE
jgi:hypothetical protein